MLTMVPGATKGWHERFPMAAKEKLPDHHYVILPSAAANIADVYLPLLAGLQELTAVFWKLGMGSPLVSNDLGLL